MKKYNFFLLLLTLILIFATTTLYTLNAYSQNNAKEYLNSHSENAWSVMGLKTLSENPNMDFLKTFQAQSAIDYTSPILAITSAGIDPRTFPNTDLVAKLKNFYDGNQIGDTGNINDDIFAILALISSGEDKNQKLIQDSLQFILQNQNQNGGWSFTVSSTPDSNTTAAALLALKTLGFNNVSPEVLKALDYLKTTQNSDGGFTYQPNSPYGSESDSSSTAWVIWALNAFDETE